MAPDNTVMNETDHRLIASDKVEGTAVYNRQREKLGSVHKFMVDKRSGGAEYVQDEGTAEQIGGKVQKKGRRRRRRNGR